MVWKMWLPAIILGCGALATVGIDPQRSMELRAPLTAAVPTVIAEHVGRDVVVAEDERRIAGMDDYVLRVYGEESSLNQSSIYVGYYKRQLQGRTIHSPKNCLPGSGWEALTSSTVPIATAAGSVIVNRYLLQRQDQRALVLYWYQGRGRIEANEYTVKLNLLRDGLLRRRSDEALVRIVVNVGRDGEDAALERARSVAAELMAPLALALPE